MTGFPSIDKPWLKYYSEEAINAPLPECSIYEYMVENNKNYPADIAFNYLGRKITYKELFENIDKTASAFIKAGVKEKEIVTVALPSIPEALYCVYALNKIGAVANMIHPLAGTEETINYINEVGSKVVVIFDGAYKTIAKDVSKTCAERIIVASPGASSPLVLKILYSLKVKSPKFSETTFQKWDDFINDGKGVQVKDVKKDVHEVAIISHTGGTTGEPKGVMCSDWNVNNLIFQIVCNFEHERQKACLVSLPPFVNYSLVESMLAMLVIGFKVALVPKYEPEKIGLYIKRYRPYAILSIPAYWEALLNKDNVHQIDMSCLRYAIYGGEGMSIESEHAINEVLKTGGARGQLCKGLGATEMVAAATSTYDDCNEEGSVGIPLNGVACKIVEPGTTKELSYNEDGEICFSGPTLMLGYYNNPEATAQVIKAHEDGERWLHTGDIGHINKNGVLYVTGRIKRIIMTKGQDGQVTKMFPDRIEKVIYTDPAVEVCCVIGIPDEKRINYPQAIVVLKPGVETGDKTKQEILGKCQEQLPTYMVPKVIEFRNDLPRTSRGKVDYRKLEQEIVG